MAKIPLMRISANNSVISMVHRSRKLKGYRPLNRISGQRSKFCRKLLPSLIYSRISAHWLSFSKFLLASHDFAKTCPPLVALIAIFYKFRYAAGISFSFTGLPAAQKEQPRYFHPPPALRYRSGEQTAWMPYECPK
ncbi:MAG TPA: hypothetical protein VHB01_02425 [Nitrosospira sp.]|nr:hypothetical protein [Nitrosospira sp.]